VNGDLSILAPSVVSLALWQLVTGAGALMAAAAALVGVIWHRYDTELPPRGDGEPSAEEMAAFRALTINEVRRRRLEAEETAQATRKGRKRYADAAFAWKGLESDLRERGVFVVDDLPDRRVAQWTRRVDLLSPGGISGQLVEARRRQGTADDRGD
jgi:hypothetical protein